MQIISHWGLENPILLHYPTHTMPSTGQLPPTTPLGNPTPQTQPSAWQLPHCPASLHTCVGAGELGGGAGQWDELSPHLPGWGPTHSGLPVHSWQGSSRGGGKGSSGGDAKSKPQA